MKIQIRDKEVFERLTPCDVAGYLRSTNWNEIESDAGHSSWWTKPYQGEEAQLLLPIDRSYRDFGLRMADLVQLIAAIENRSQLAVIDDIQTAGADVIRIQLRLADSAHGTIPMERGAAIYDNIPELFSAGACAAQGPRIYYATRKSKPVEDFIKQLRFGQTEYGSYIVRVLSPVPPAMTDMFGNSEEPFQRQAIQALVGGLAAVKKAADLAVASGGGKWFEDGVKDGVSANLCAALANIAGHDTRPADTLAVRLTPSRTRPLAIRLPESISFSGDSIPIIREAARVLKAVAPSEEQEIQGFVVKLQTTDEGNPPAGPVTVSTVIEGRQRKVTIDLPEAEHAQAIQAYRDGAEIACRGKLTKVGQLWTLQNPGRITILSDQ